MTRLIGFRFAPRIKQHCFVFSCCLSGFSDNWKKNWFFFSSMLLSLHFSDRSTSETSEISAPQMCEHQKSIWGLSKLRQCSRGGNVFQNQSCLSSCGAKHLFVLLSLPPPTHPERVAGLLTTTSSHEKCPQRERVALRKLAITSNNVRGFKAKYNQLQKDNTAASLTLLFFCFKHHFFLVMRQRLKMILCLLWVAKTPTGLPPRAPQPPCAVKHTCNVSHSVCVWGRRLDTTLSVVSVGRKFGRGGDSEEDSRWQSLSAWQQMKEY